MLGNINFVNQYFFWLLLILPIIGYWFFKNLDHRYASLRFPTLQAFSNTTSWKSRLRILLPILRALSFIALVVALARPQAILKEEEINAEGIDIALIMDLSSSMLARDFKPDRLEASKIVASDFVKQREYDRVGLVVFAGEAFTQCPVTTDHKVVQEFLGNLQCGVLADGTAIGDGLATGVNRLKDSEAKSKVIILLTDGVNNSGYIQPTTAAEIAKEYGIKVYTIGIGSDGDALTPIGRRGDGEYIFGFAQVEIDEELLHNISEMTNGKYFRATNEEALKNIYAEIDQLEKTKIEVTSIKRHSEEFHIWALLAIIFIILEILLRYTIFRAIP